ncbi:MAG TPA: oligosaccharide flippase family protein [Polyangia bacterium]|nr:oligosaccharide flippase family protein [Polyangia bacterium]
MTQPPAAPEAERAAATRADDRKHTRRGAATNILTLAGQSTSLIFGTVAARLFGQAAWGAYTTSMAWLDVLTRLALAGNDKGLLVFIAARRGTGDRAGVVRALVTALRITAVLGILAALAMAAASWLIARANGQPLDGLAMRIMAPLAATSSMATVMLAATMATKNLRYNLAARGIAEPAALLLLATLLGLTVPRMWALAMTAVIASALALLVACVGLLRKFALREIVQGLRQEPTERAIISYTVPLALGELINIVVFRLPVFLMVAYAVPAQRAVFNTCLLLAAAVSFLRGAFDAVLAAMAAEAWAMNDRARLAENLQRQCRLVLFAAIPFGSLFIVGGPTLLGLYGPGFVSGTRALAWLAIGHVVNSSLGLVGWLHMASGRTRLVLINNLVALVVILALCLALIPRFGVDGAAAATAATLILTQLIFSVEGYSFARIHAFSSGFMRLAAIGILVIAAEWAVARFFAPAARSTAGPLLVTLAGLPIYLGLAWWGAGIGSDRRASKKPAAAG